MLVVKKYANRRLYDTSQSRYITVEDLADRIRKGADVQILDAHTNEDLTQQILTQIILESRGGARLLPVKLLVRLIRMEDDALAEFFGRYVSWALEMYVHARQGARSFLPMNPLATAPFAATDALARLVLGASPWRGQEPAAPAPPPPPPITTIVEPPPDPGPSPPTGRMIADAIDEETGKLAHDVGEQMARLREEIEALKRSVSPGRTPAKKKTKKKAASKR